MMIIPLYNNASLQTMMFRFKTSKMPPCYCDAGMLCISGTNSSWHTSDFIL